MNPISNNNISFGVSKNDKPAIKNACESISERITDKDFRVQPINFEEMKEKVYLTAAPCYGVEKGPILRVDLTDKKGINAFTYIPTKSVQACKEYLNSQKAVEEISDIVDDLKKRADKAAYRESYRD